MYAIVTGASRGIGKEITAKLLEKEYKVLGTAKSSDFPAEFNDHKQFEGRHLNLADLSSAKEKIKPLFDAEEPPDVLINNAGVFTEADMSSDQESWLNTWDNTLNVNLRTPAVMSKWAVNAWTKRKEGGSLINIASRAAYRGDTQEYAAYAASKGGLVALTKSIARDFGTENISAYSIAPGFIKTDMAIESIETYGEEYLTQGSAFDEITSPDQVAELVAFLASGKVSHMTGSTFHINGGSYMI